MTISYRVLIRKPTQADGQEVLALHERSREFHFPWVVLFLKEQGFQDYLRRCQGDDFEGLLICHSQNNRIIGVANLGQISYRSFQNAYLGYYADVNYARQGLMTEGIHLVMNYAFYTLGLHRVEANIQPDNQASIRFIQRLGFRLEGFSQRYLYINGAWRDHQRWAITVEEWEAMLPSVHPTNCG